MSAWVRFINKTKYKAIYIDTDGLYSPLLLCNEEASRYIFSSDGTIRVKIFDKKGKLIKDTPYSVIPARLNTIVLL